MNKFISLSDAIKRYVKNDISIALEGFTHLIPFAAGHEIIRQGIVGLTLIRMTPDIIYDQMIGSGCAKKLIFSWGGNPGVGSLYRLRDAVENQWPQPLLIQEHSHADMANAYVAGASNLPFAVIRGHIQNDLSKYNNTIKTITCPFTGEELCAVPSIRPDVTIIHAQQADQYGNVLIHGIVGVQKEAALAAKKIIVTVEEVVDKLSDVNGSVILPHFAIHAISLVPNGAFPSYAHGYYCRSNSFYKYWNDISKDRVLFSKWVNNYIVESADTTQYIEKLEGLMKCV
jgi:glutaconate CoA-transferase, subunit A